MNKSLKIMAIAGALLTLTAFNANACQAEPDFNKPMPEEQQMDGKFPPPPPADSTVKKHRPPSPEAFEKRLGLTEEQKEFAKAQREASIEKIKPIIEQIKNKKAEIEMIKLSKMAQQAIDERVAQLESEIKTLRKQAHEIRKENMKAFESILTDAQKKELHKMKAEGRKKFEKMKKERQKAQQRVEK